MKFKPLSFKFKMMLISLSWVGLLSTALVIAFFSQRIQKHAQAEYQKSKEAVQIFNNVLNVMINLETGIRGYLLSGEEAYLEPFNQNEAKFNQAIEAAKPILADEPAQLESLNKIADFEAQWMSGPVMEEMMARKKLQRKMITMDEFILAFTSSKGKTFSDGVRTQVQISLDLEAKKMVDLAAGQEKATRNLQIIIFGVIPACTLIGLLLMLSSVFKVNSTMQSLIQSFTDTVKNLEENSSSLSNLSRNLTHSSNEVSSSTQKTASSTLQINAMTSKNVTLTEESIGFAKKCLTTSERGVQVVESVRSSIETVSQASEEIHNVIVENNQKINSITKMMENIKSKTNVINEIVFQTKLLSFNASVEAARAGENGKGFSVVAEEVGSLAQMSGTAAKEISLLLESSSAEVQSIVKETVESMDRLYKEIQTKIKSSTEMSVQSSEIILTMKEDIASVETITHQIALASKEQAIGIEEVNKAIQNIDQITSDLTDRSGDCAEVSEDLEKYSTVLSQQMLNLGQIFGTKNSNGNAA
jgi:methyl-accepting chemotaxis protein